MLDENSGLRCLRAALVLGRDENLPRAGNEKAMDTVPGVEESMLFLRGHRHVGAVPAQADRS